MSTFGGGTFFTPSGGSLIIQDEGTPLPTQGTMDFQGAGVTATDDPGNGKTIVTIPGGGGGSFVPLPAMFINSNQAAQVNKAYFTQGTSRVEVALPTTSAQGDVLCVVSDNDKGWKITQGAGQQISVGNKKTTEGASGFLITGDGVEDITNDGDVVYLYCTVANLKWRAINWNGIINTDA